MEKLALFDFDEKRTMERFLNDKDLFWQCLEMFMDDKSFEGLMESAKAGKLDEAFDFAHSLKGVSANLGLGSLNGKICELVEVLRKKTPDDRIVGMCEDVEKERERLIKTLA